MIEFTFPCSKGAIDVVETPNAALDAKVLCVVLAEFLGCKLLQAIGILRLQGKRSKEIKISLFNHCLIRLTGKKMPSYFR